MNETTLIRSYPILRIIMGRTDSFREAALRALGALSVLPILILGAAALEQALILDPGTGVLEHFGFWSFAITAPVIITLTWLLLQKSTKLMTTLSRFSMAEEFPPQLRRIVRESILHLGGRTSLGNLLILGMIAGLFYVGVNLRWVSDSIRFYGTFTFDSPNHLLVFIFNRLNLILHFAFILPTALFVSIGVTIFMHRVLRFMAEAEILQIDLFHSDNCGGFSEFGSLNAIIMGIYFCILSNILMSIQSHPDEIHMTLLPLFVMSALIILQSLFAVYYIHRCVKAKKKDALRMVNEKLNNEFREFRSTGKFSSDLLVVRSHILTIRTYPYASHVLSVVNILRLGPAALALTRLWAG